MHDTPINPAIDAAVARARALHDLGRLPTQIEDRLLEEGFDAEVAAEACKSLPRRVLLDDLSPLRPKNWFSPASRRGSLGIEVEWGHVIFGTALLLLGVGLSLASENTLFYGLMIVGVWRILHGISF